MGGRSGHSGPKIDPRIGLRGSVLSLWSDLVQFGGMNLLRSISSSPWMLHPSIAKAYAPLAFRLLRGESVEFEKVKARYPYRASATGRHAKEGQDGMMIYHLEGVVTKHDQACGPMGTDTLMKYMKDMDREENVRGHMLVIDSGGGEGTNCDTFARCLRDLEKPVVAWFNGYCCSAAYYIAAGATEVYASQATDIAGSIGVYVTLADWKKFYAEQGLDIHEIYAEQSDLKNSDARIALEEGDYQMIRENFLNPYAQAFINTIQELRPQITDEEVYRGQSYMAADALDRGLIDGISSFEVALARLFELSNTPNTNSRLPEMKFPKIEAQLGYTLEQHNGGVFLREAELQALEAAIVGNDDTVVNATQLTEMSENIAALTTTVGTLVDQVEANANRIEEVAAAPAVTPTAALAEEDPAEPLADTDALTALEAQLADAQANGVVRFTK